MSARVLGVAIDTVSAIAEEIRNATLAVSLLPFNSATLEELGERRQAICLRLGEARVAAEQLTEILKREKERAL